MDTPLKIDISNEIQSTLAALTESTKVALQAEISKICISEKGTLTFSTTMKNKANRAAERLILTFVSEAVEQVSAISASPQAYLLIHNSVSSVILDLEDIVASGGFLPPSSNVSESISNDFERIRDRILPSLELHRSIFAKSKSRTGRPPESEWEQIEAFILEQFPVGSSSSVVTKAAIKRNIEFWLQREKRAPPSEGHLWVKAREIYNKYYIVKY